MSDSPDYVRDTIVAPATPPGAGGIAVVRLSGPLVPDIAATMIGGLPEARVATLRSFRGPDGEVIDRGIALYFPAPASFTGEPVLELQGHGGPVVVSRLAAAAARLGARRAEPGEFSRRAFLNDKLDLVQAEAIADLVASGSGQAARAAMRSLAGAFSQAVAGVEEKLTALRLHVEAAIDFPEEEIDFLADPALDARLLDCEAALETLIGRASVGRVLRDGYRVVLAGPPNAGKSSLLNRLAGEEAAIVTEVAGTTRDILRETVDFDGLSVELVDTAGLRSDPDRIEAEGIRRAREALRQADAALWILDASATDGGEVPDEELPAAIPVIAVRNKIDLTAEPPGRSADGPGTVAISAKTGAGIDVLREAIRELAGYRDLGEGAFTARQRHLDALCLAQAHFRAGRTALEDTRAGELLAEELRLAQRALGAIRGQVTSDELLGRIFSTFCIGK